MNQFVVKFKLIKGNWDRLFTKIFLFSKNHELCKNISEHMWVSRVRGFCSRIWMVLNSYQNNFLKCWRIRVNCWQLVERESSFESSGNLVFAVMVWNQLEKKTYMRAYSDINLLIFISCLILTRTTYLYMYKSWKIYFFVNHVHGWLFSITYFNLTIS